MRMKEARLSLYFRGMKAIKLQREENEGRIPKERIRIHWKEIISKILKLFTYKNEERLCNSGRTSN